MTTEAIIPSPAAMAEGAKGFKLGKYVGMPRWDYDAAPGVSHTMLGNWVRGSAKTATRAMLVGSALHTRMEGRSKFDATYIEIEDVNLTTKEGKKIKEDAERESHRTAIKRSEIALVVAMFKAIAGHDVGRRYIESTGEREVAVFNRIGRKDSKILPEHPTLMKGIIDLMAASDLDLKTVGWPSREDFKNNIVNYGYDSQAALYRELAASVRNGEYRPFHWLCVMKEPPHDVWVETPTNYMMSSGLRWINTCLTLYERTI